MAFKINPYSGTLSEKNFWVVEALDGRKRGRIPCGTRHAAVLIPLYEKDGALYVVLTKRTDSVAHHKGQISFPGGVCEDGDMNLEATALREAFEEIRIRPRDVKILGMLDDVETHSSEYVVTAVVGLIPSAYCFTLNRDEVESVIEVPVGSLYEMAGVNGVEYLHEAHRIWGLTASILKQLLDLRTN